jgi:ABC-type multidrug transport system fused ATPase/permease subunit
MTCYVYTAYSHIHRSFLILTGYIVFNMLMCLYAMRPPKKKIVKVADASSNANYVEENLVPVSDLEAPAEKPVQASQGRQYSQVTGSKAQGGWVSKSVSAGSHIATKSIPRLNDLSLSVMSGNLAGASVSRGPGGASNKEELEHEEWKPEVALTPEYYKSKSASVELARGCRLVFSGLVYKVPNPKQRGSELTLLNGVDGIVNAGEMCALMGASGAGKSTLLDVLAGRKTVGTITGDILFNGAPRSAAVMKSVAYVMQDNVHIGTLTVKQTLYYAAELRLSEFMSRKDKDQRIEQVITMLGLEHVANTM